MTATHVYWKVREALIEWGLVSRPRCPLRRRPAGTVRNRLVGRGTSRRLRRVPLPRLLRL